MIGFNGGLIGKLRTYALSGASSGVWTLQEQAIIRSLVAASGGNTTADVAIDGINYRVHTFTADGTFTVTNGGTIEYLIIGGGGGGGGGWQGGGGGAGGYLLGTTVVSPQEYTITVGAGGIGCRTITQTTVPTNGGNSSIALITAIGGGRGASESVVLNDAGPGGSGGGGIPNAGATALIGANGTDGQGNRGGDGLTTNYLGGGGGGSGAAAANAVSTDNPPLGGAGTSTNFSGTTATYAAGGNGIRRSTGGTGNSGAPNTGNGGAGGANSSNGAGVGGNGGSGIVFIRYPIARSVPGGDLNFSSVTLLLHCNGTNGSTFITDTSLSARTVTTIGNAQISTAQSKFGGASLALDGTGDYGLINTQMSAFEYSADFTIEGWFYFNAISGYQGIIGSGVNADQTGHAIIIENNNTLAFLGATTTTWNTVITTTTIPTTGIWHHIAVSRSGSTVRLFYNGTQVGITTSSNFIRSGTSIRIGGYEFIPGGGPTGLRSFNGYIDEVRITKGFPRYTANFTPPTEPFPNF